MLDENIKAEKKEGKTYPPLPKDIYQVELLDVNSEKRPTYDTRFLPPENQDLENVFKFQFTLLEGKDKDVDLRGRNIWDNFVPAYLYVGKNGKNKLYRIVEALLGRELTASEAFDGITGKMLNELIGKQCRVSIEPKTKGDKTWNIVVDLLKANNLLTPLTSEEKENAKVKPKEEKENSIDEEAGISMEDIPF